MTLSFWEPFRDLDRFDRVVSDLFGQEASARAVAERARRPAADLAADKEGYVFRFDLPGVPKDAIDISVENDVLTISGERKPSLVAEEGRTIYRRETPSGRFERSFRLPEDADAERVSAAYADGVLEVRVPRAPQVQPRRIPISAS
jgi:HSP20 family protein